MPADLNILLYNNGVFCSGVEYELGIEVIIKANIDDDEVIVVFKWDFDFVFGRSSTE
ncbi:MAG: hypothetical protein R2769_03500 [Saprospiraceae bacterium]